MDSVGRFISRTSRSAPEVVKQLSERLSDQYAPALYWFAVEAPVKAASSMWHVYSAFMELLVWVVLHATSASATLLEKSASAAVNTLLSFVRALNARMDNAIATTPVRIKDNLVPQGAAQAPAGSSEEQSLASGSGAGKMLQSLAAGGTPAAKDDEAGAVELPMAAHAAIHEALQPQSESADSALVHQARLMMWHSWMLMRLTGESIRMLREMTSGLLGWSTSALLHLSVASALVMAMSAIGAVACGAAFLAAACAEGMGAVHWTLMWTRRTGAASIQLLLAVLLRAEHGLERWEPPPRLRHHPAGPPLVAMRGLLLSSVNRLQEWMEGFIHEEGSPDTGASWHLEELQSSTRLWEGAATKLWNAVRAVGWTAVEALRAAFLELSQLTTGAPLEVPWLQADGHEMATHTMRGVLEPHIGKIPTQMLCTAANITGELAKKTYATTIAHVSHHASAVPDTLAQVAARSANVVPEALTTVARTVKSGIPEERDEVKGEDQGGDGKQADPNREVEATHPDCASDAKQHAPAGEEQQQECAGEGKDPGGVGEGKDPNGANDVKQPAPAGEKQQQQERAGEMAPDRGGEGQDPNRAGEGKDPNRTGEGKQAGPAGESKKPDGGGESEQPAAVGEKKHRDPTKRRRVRTEKPAESEDLTPAEAIPQQGTEEGDLQVGGGSSDAAAGTTDTAPQPPPYDQQQVDTQQGRPVDKPATPRKSRKARESWIRQEDPEQSTTPPAGSEDDPMGYVLCDKPLALPVFRETALPHESNPGRPHRVRSSAAEDRVAKGGKVSEVVGPLLASKDPTSQDAAVPETAAGEGYKEALPDAFGLSSSMAGGFDPYGRGGRSPRNAAHLTPLAPGEWQHNLPPRQGGV